MTTAIDMSIARSHRVLPHQPAFEIGDVVEIDDKLGGTYVIRAIDDVFAWLFSEIEGFETVELSELRWPLRPHLL